MDKEEAIWRSKMDGTEKEKFITTGILHCAFSLKKRFFLNLFIFIGLILPQGVAYDWIGGNLYFTDSKKRHIAVCTGNGRSCTVLIEELGKPRDLALHPNLGVLYWTDWGLSPAIMRAGLDGSIPLAIIHENLKWPNGIAIDHGNGRIYWTDAGMDLIETANLEGEDRRVVHSTGIKHPFGIDVFGDHVYWSDWNMYQIQVCFYKKLKI
jgi:sugar lactone lactonase YvrE